MEQLLGIGRTVRDGSNALQEIDYILKLYNSPQQLTTFYSMIYPDERLIVKDFNFHTINEIVERYVEVRKDSTAEVTFGFEIGYKNLGMGHACVLVYDVRVNKYYFRHEGGSNGIERENVYNYFECGGFDPTKIGYKNKLFDIDDALWIVIHSKCEEFMFVED